LPALWLCGGWQWKREGENVRLCEQALKAETLVIVFSLRKS
jgi:hypothetical protein